MIAKSETVKNWVFTLFANSEPARMLEIMKTHTHTGYKHISWRERKSPLDLLFWNISKCLWGRRQTQIYFCYHGHLHTYIFNLSRGNIPSSFQGCLSNLSFRLALYTSTSEIHGEFSSSSDFL